MNFQSKIGENNPPTTLTNITMEKPKNINELMVDVGAKVSEARIKCGMTQEKLAMKIRSSQPVIARIESGARLPSLNFLFNISKACKVSMDWFFVEDGTLDE